MENNTNKTAVAENSKTIGASVTSALALTQSNFVAELTNGGLQIDIQYDNYQKLCASNVVAAMLDILKTQGKTFKDIDNANVLQILQQVALLRVNITNVPRECFLELRNSKIGDNWIPKFNLGLEGDGNDKILRKHGNDVKEVRSPWLVKFDDEFTYPSFSGLEIKAPTWTPKSYNGKVRLVCYPVIKKDSSVEWLISERNEVVNNLKAHIANALLGKDYKDIRQSVIDKMNEIDTLDTLLGNSDFMKYASPAWTNSHSQEAMIIRKMRNNATKKYPKNFESVFQKDAYEATFDDYDQYREVNKVNTQAVDAEFLEKETEAHIETTASGEVITPKAKVAEPASRHTRDYGDF